MLGRVCNIFSEDFLNGLSIERPTATWEELLAKKNDVTFVYVVTRFLLGCRVACLLMKMPAMQLEGLVLLICTEN